MPLDFREKIAQDEADLEALLVSRKAGIDANIAQSRAAIGKGRSNALGVTFQSQLAGLPISQGAIGAGMASAAGQQGRLENTLEGTLGEQRFALDRERINMVYNRALDRAKMATSDRQSAEAYARQVMQDEIRRQTEAGANEKARQNKIRRADISNSAIARGAEFDAAGEDTGQGEYQAALMRVLSGMPVQLMSLYSLKNDLRNPFGEQQPTQPYSGRLPENQSFSTRIDPVTGRRI